MRITFLGARLQARASTWLGLGAVLVACYAEPATHPVRETELELDAGELDAGDELDAEPGEDAARSDARVIGSDAAAVPDAGDGCGGCAAKDPSRPYCVGPAGAKRCVACSAEPGQACGTGKVCDLTAGSCVGCLAQSHCTTAKASVCDLQTHECKPCSDGSQTDCQIAGLTACLAGECVQCTATDRDACKTAGGADAVCDASKRMCSPSAVAGTDLCGECVADAQCKAGQRCVETTYDTAPAGRFCLWQENGGGGAPSVCESPFISPQMLPSVDAPGGSFTMCTLAATTCTAHTLMRASTACGRYANGSTSVIVANYNDPMIPIAERGTPAAAQKISPDSSICGTGGFCAVQNAGAAAYRCTTRCGNVDDCTAPRTCTTGNFCSI